MHKNEDISVTGHSLGGGIALGISVRYGIDAVVFDSSPRIFDGLCDNHCKAKRVLIYQNNEFLEKARKKWSKISEVLTNEDTYRTNCDFNGNSNHRMDYLAKCLLKLGAKENSDLENIYKEIK